MAAESDGLNALDRNRAASLADEGGAAGAITERQESRPPGSPSPAAMVLAGAAGLLVAIVAWQLLEELTMRKTPPRRKSDAFPRPVPASLENER